MLLPCPHCRRRFNLPTQRIPSRGARGKCPACGGWFAISLASPSTPAGHRTGSVDSRLAGDEGDDPGKDAIGGPGYAGVYAGAHVSETGPAGQTLDRARPRFMLFWTLVPACCLLLALGGILLSGPWVGLPLPDVPPSQTARGTGGALSSSVSSRPERLQHPGNPAARAFWAAAIHPADPCGKLFRVQADLRGTGEEDPCAIYPLWITCLVLRTGSMLGCDLEPAFGLASEGLAAKALCGPGHAFLAAYYLEKRVLDRSQSFLDEALRLAPHDPWVKLVEAVVYERAYDDDEKAIPILKELSGRFPSIPLARYLLGEAYIRGGKYRDAGATFATLQGKVEGRAPFWRIRRALFALEGATAHSTVQAKALLALSRSFRALEDYPMARDLYLRVLDGMPGSLPERDRIAAYCELGRIYEQQGDNSSAYQAYRSAFELNPEFPAARKGIRAVLPSSAEDIARKPKATASVSPPS